MAINLRFPGHLAAKTSLCALAALLAAHPLITQAAGADSGVCNAAAKRANLGFTLSDIDGNGVLLSAYRGQVILLNFWATWCAPCKTEIPWLVELHGKYRERGLVVLGVSVDEAVSQIKPFAAALRMNYPVLVGAGRDDFQEAFGPLYGFPTSVLISRDGAICMRHTGIATKEALERDVAALL
jgi:thiol-disulfide isomerase/thioredoxin